MEVALTLIRAFHFVSVMLAFGVAAFRLYAVGASEASVLAALDMRLRVLLVSSASVALLSAMALVPITAGRMAGSTPAALDLHTIKLVLFHTSFGRVWCWHMFLAA